MTTSADTQYIAEYLQESTQQAQQLLQLLRDERNIISSNDALGLEDIAASKEKLAEVMQAHTQLCYQFLQQVGYSENTQGLVDYFQHSTNEHFNVKWQELQSILKECKDENTINGKLLSNSQYRIKQALSILQGEPLDEELYGRGGKTVNSSNGNSLTHA